MPGTEKIRCLFGTDGVRDLANRGVMIPEMALRLARAYVWWLIRNGHSRPTIIVGRDTRRSGGMLEAAIVTGLTSSGAEVKTIGVIPTPGVSCAILRTCADGGVVLSASHNPAEYNGIKFFDASGSKLTDDAESEIEEFLEDTLLDDWRPTGASIGGVEYAQPLRNLYIDMLAAEAERLGDFQGRFAVDTAHGAATAIMEEVVHRAGWDAQMLGNAPNGLNINEGTGVMNLHHLQQYVVEQELDFGYAFDGDADRVLFVDRQGRVIDGDIMLWVMARWMKRQSGKGVVATVMSNMALEEHLGHEGITLTRCPVGDRYVLAQMRNTEAAVGGEQSGHIIVRDYTTTGDGPNTAILFMRACRELGEEIDTLVDRFHRYPQTLHNISVADKAVMLGHPRLKEVTSSLESMMNGRGRILIRPSGTEPLVRVLVEARERGLLEQSCRELLSVIEEINQTTAVQ
ncbi:MAG: phosphoglucosamine mutase [Synergistales bacterium]|nr:phosphoglucosamine mutase [Synergistales bacterium]